MKHLDSHAGRAAEAVDLLEKKSTDPRRYPPPEPSIELKIVKAIKGTVYEHHTSDRLKALIAKYTARDESLISSRDMYFFLLKTVKKFFTKEEVFNMLGEFNFPWRFNHLDTPIDALNYLFIGRILCMPVTQYQNDLEVV
jgi:hypothetical protein